MNKKYLLVLFAIAILAVLLVSGCVKTEEDTDTDTGDEDTDTDTGTTPIDTGDEDTETPAETGCTTNDDCNDDDRCTTDSCDNGECKHTVEADCEQTSEAEAHISEVQFTGNEYVQIDGDNWDISEWTIENPNGTVFIEFPDYTTLNGFMRIFSGCDLSTTQFKYVCIGNDDFWSDSGDKAFLIDEVGNTISEMAG